MAHAICRCIAGTCRFLLIRHTTAIKIPIIRVMHLQTIKHNLINKSFKTYLQNDDIDICKNILEYKIKNGKMVLRKYFCNDSRINALLNTAESFLKMVLRKYFCKDSRINALLNDAESFFKSLLMSKSNLVTEDIFFSIQFSTLFDDRKYNH